MDAKSVAETGAKPGDTVICVSSEVPFRFRPGNEYLVVDFCGTASVHGHTDEPNWRIPWRGWGGGMAPEIPLTLR